jgi:hypothetical protein
MERAGAGLVDNVLPGDWAGSGDGEEGAARMTHEDLCERARHWLSGSRRCDPVFSNIASCGEVPDAIGWSSCYQWCGSTVVEAKTSRADFYADHKKYQAYFPHEEGLRYARNRITQKEAEARGWKLIDLARMGNFRFFICEPGIVTAELVEKFAPDHGLLWMENARRLKLMRPAMRREKAMVDTDAEIRYLRFAIINGKNRFTVEDLDADCAECQHVRPAMEGLPMEGHDL